MSRIRTSSGTGELLVELRRDTGVPLHQQVESGIRTRIRAGLLRADTVMPSTRALATDLGLSLSLKWPFPLDGSYIAYNH